MIQIQLHILRLIAQMTALVMRASSGVTAICFLLAWPSIAIIPLSRVFGQAAPLVRRSSPSERPSSLRSILPLCFPVPLLDEAGATRARCAKDLRVIPISSGSK